MAKNILNPLPPATGLSITAQVNTVVATMRPYNVAITDKQKKGKRTMAEGREGFVRLVSRIAFQHPNSLSRSDNPGDLLTALDTDALLESAKQATKELYEMLNDTQFANSRDIMELTKAYTRALQLDRERNAALDSAMKEVDEWNARYSHSNNSGNAPQTEETGNTPA